MTGPLDFIEQVINETVETAGEIATASVHSGLDHLPPTPSTPDSAKTSSNDQNKK